MTSDYATVTEIPGAGASSEQIEMLYTRYAYAVGFCDDKDVLEVACGPGLGLGYLEKRARRIVGGDYTEDFLRMARCHYKERVPLVRLDAHALPFQAHSFDVVILHEAIYYLRSAEQFIEECRRVLRVPGVLVISTVNKEWSDFNPSPFSTRYFSASELSDLLRRHEFQAELHGAFLAVRESVGDVMVSVLKRAAVAFGLMPRTMKGKELLKRIFYGRLRRIPPEIDLDTRPDGGPYTPLRADMPIREHKVLFAVGRMR